MAIIDSAGLFLGDRLGWCSDAAQLHWPRLYSAANNFARLELNYRKILSKAYANFRTPPAEQEFWAMIREYKDNFLLLVYQTDDGVLWGQWQTNERYLLGHKNADDRRSPAPPLDAQDAYRNAYLDRKKSKSSTNVGLADLLGVVPTCSESCDLPVLTVAGVGVGGGDGVGGGKDVSLATQALAVTPSGVPAAVFTLPLADGEWPVIQEFYDELMLLYPKLNVLIELTEIREDLKKNPRKMARGMPKYIVSKLEKKKKQALALEKKRRDALAKKPGKWDIAKARHREFKAAIGLYWNSANPSVEMPWGPVEGRELEMWLRGSPTTTVEQFTGYLRNRFKSKANHTDRPSLWIRHVTSYATEPLNKFRQPQSMTGGNNGKPEQTLSSAQRLDEKLRREAMGEQEVGGGRIDETRTIVGRLHTGTSG